MQTNRWFIWAISLLLLAAGNGAAKGIVLCVGSDGHVSFGHHNDKSCCHDEHGHCHSEENHACELETIVAHEEHSCIDIPIWINSVDLDVSQAKYVVTDHHSRNTVAELTYNLTAVKSLSIKDRYNHSVFHFQPYTSIKQTVVLRM